MGNKIAGIDVHKKVLMVVVLDPLVPDLKPERRGFTTMPSELHRLSTWLKESDVEEAVMESTAQYWRSVWLELEPHMVLHLAQAFSNRAPRGRKHDFKDAERLVRRLIAKELIASTFPSAAELTSWVGTCPGKEESAEENSSSRSASQLLRSPSCAAAHAEQPVCNRSAVEPRREARVPRRGQRNGRHRR